MEGFDTILEMLPLLIPLLLIQLILLVVALVDLARRERVSGGNKLVWGLVIVLVNIIGPIAYLIWGREEQ